MAAMGERLLAGPAASMRAKLTEKGRCRPTAMIRPLLPAGVSSLEGVPMLDAHGAGNADGPTEAALQKYLDEIRNAAKIFARCNHKEGTLAEHDTYPPASWGARVVVTPSNGRVDEGSEGP